MKLKRLSEDKSTNSDKCSLFTRGYNDVQAKLSRRNRFVMSCYNCEYYYQAEGDEDEMCQNPEVLRYDMTVSENGVCCAKWKPLVRSQSIKGLFKKGGKTSG